MTMITLTQKGTNNQVTIDSSEVGLGKKQLEVLHDWAIDLGPCPACKALKGDPCFKFGYKENRGSLDTYGVEYVHAERLDVFKEK